MQCQVLLFSTKMYKTRRLGLTGGRNLFITSHTVAMFLVWMKTGTSSHPSILDGGPPVCIVWPPRAAESEQWPFWWTQTLPFCTEVTLRKDSLQDSTLGGHKELPGQFSVPLKCKSIFCFLLCFLFLVLLLALADFNSLRVPRESHLMHDTLWHKRHTWPWNFSALKR